MRKIASCRSCSCVCNVRLCNIIQVYSQLSFTCPRNKTIVVFKQELRETNTGESLLEDAESIDCRSVHMMSETMCFIAQC